MIYHNQPIIHFITRPYCLGQEGPQGHGLFSSWWNHGHVMGSLGDGT